MGYFHGVVAVRCEGFKTVRVCYGSLLTCVGVAVTDLLAGDITWVILPFDEESVFCYVCVLGGSGVFVIDVMLSVDGGCCFVEGLI